MQSFLGNMGIILTQVLSWLGQIAVALLSNEIFQILVAIIIFILLISLILLMLEYKTGWATKAYWNRQSKK